MYEILCSQQEDRPRDALPCCKDHADSLSMPMWPSPPHLQHGRPLPPPFVARPDAATVLLATIAVCHLLPHLVLPQWNHVVDRFFLRVVAVHALTV